jgi:nucleoside-diphosphate-sugar epimerase
MNVMVIGGAGFIGAYVVKALLAEGDQVTVYDMLLSANTLTRILTPDELAQVTMVSGDVTDLPSMMRAIRENEVESLIHLAYWQIPASHNNPTQAIKVNSLGFNYSLEAAASLNLKRVVWTSSNAVFGSSKFQDVVPLPNDAVQIPNTVYGSLKSGNEYMAKHYAEHRGVDSIGFRLSLVYGFGRMRGASTFASDMIVNAAIGEPCEIAMGDSEVDWYYVEDAANLLVRGLKAPSTPTRIYNANSDVRTVRQAAEYLSSILPDAKLTILPGEIDANWNLDSALMEKELGFKPRYSLEDGMKEMVAMVLEDANLPPKEGIQAARHYAR